MKRPIKMLLIVMLTSIIVSFSSYEETSSERSISPNDTISSDTVLTTRNKFGYIDADKLMQNCGYAREFLAYSKEQMDNYEAMKRNINEQVKKRWEDARRKEANGGFLSTASRDAYFNEIRDYENRQAAQLRDREQRVIRDIAQHREMLNDTIQKYALSFSLANQFDALFIKEDALWRNIVDNPNCTEDASEVVTEPKYNVTADFINFLNASCGKRVTKNSDKVQ